MSHSANVLIIDFGSQYTQLIARRIRQMRVYCEIHPPSMNIAAIQAFAPGAIILSGGPSSVNDADAPHADPGIVALGIPILGICYGQQWLASHMGGRVVPSTHREYGRASVRAKPNLHGVGAQLLAAFAPSAPFEVWMSHGDRIDALPPDFESIAETSSTPYAAIAHKTKPIVGLQFHPEVTHTPQGTKIIEAFLLSIARLSPSWTMESFLHTQIDRVKAQVGADEQVICGLSGGVDSSVVAATFGAGSGPAFALHFRGQWAGAARRVHGCARGFRARDGRRLACGRCARPIFRCLGGGDRPGAQAQDHRQGLHRCFRAGGQADQRRPLLGARNPLSRCHRVGQRQRAIGHHQKAITTWVVCPRT